MNGMQFRASRLALGMTQSELADAMDLTNDTISRMERFAERIDKRTELAISMLLSKCTDSTKCRTPDDSTKSRNSTKCLERIRHVILYLEFVAKTYSDVASRSDVDVEVKAYRDVSRGLQQAIDDLRQTAIDNA